MASFFFLGTGTSNGVPVIGCDCEVCRSDDPRDNRLRSSGYYISDAGTRILIDAGVDFRQQALRHEIRAIDGILITHSHQDHIGGIDELRQINYIMKQKMELYGTDAALEEIKARFDYIFKPTQIGGGKPQLNLNPVHGSFKIKDQLIIPIHVLHGEIPILGYRMGGLTYITDASVIPEESMELINGTKVLVINALRFVSHPTHFNLEEALGIIEKIKPVQSYLIHMTHNFYYRRDNEKLPQGVAFAYDGLKLDIND